MIENKNSKFVHWIKSLILLGTISLFFKPEVVFGDDKGIASKGLWDWLELLIIPVALGLGAWWLKREERKKEHAKTLEADRRNLLATYFDRMQELLLEYKLLEGNIRQEVIEIARARTLYVFRNLDGERKGHVIRFLVDTGALALKRSHDQRSIVRLSYADLSGASLENVHLEGVNLWCANLENANLSYADLVGTNLPYAFMREAKLDNADLSGANLEHAVVYPVQLKQARSLKGAVMPDGLTFEEWESAGEPDWTHKGMPRKWTTHEARYS